MVLKINYFLIKKVKKVDYKFIKNGLKIAEFLWDILVFLWNICVIIYGTFSVTF